MLKMMKILSVMKNFFQILFDRIFSHALIFDNLVQKHLGHGAQVWNRLNDRPVGLTTWESVFQIPVSFHTSATLSPLLNVKVIIKNFPSCGALFLEGT